MKFENQWLPSMALIVSNINQKNVVDHSNDLFFKKNDLVGIVSNTHLNQRLQHQMNELNYFCIEIMVEVLQKISNLCHHVDIMDCLLLISNIILHVSVLPITHQP